jgi:hypothetical protein
MKNTITKKYTIEFTEGSDSIIRTKIINNGFSDFVILGMVEYAKLQITKYMDGNTNEAIVNKERITIDYVIKNCDISERLRKALIDYVKEYGIKYLEDVDGKLMNKRIRGAGALTINELEILKDKLK